MSQCHTQENIKNLNKLFLPSHWYPSSLHSYSPPRKDGNRDNASTPDRDNTSASALRMATQKDRKNILVRNSFKCREKQTHYSKFRINQNHYGIEGEDVLISLPADLSPDEYLQKCLSLARDDAEKSRIKHEFEIQKVGPILNRRSMANNAMLQTVKEESKFDGDDVEIEEAINWARGVCKYAEENDYYVYAFKGSLDEHGGLKQGEAINKIDGGSHAIFIGVPEWSNKFNRWVLRKLKKEEIGIIGEEPKPGQLIQVSWESLGCNHTETHSLLFEAVGTHTLKAYFPEDRQQCFNIDYTGIPRKYNDKFVQLTAILLVKLLVPIGRNGVQYTDRGLSVTGRFPLTGLPNQEGNVLPLKNDLERKWRKDQKAKDASTQSTIKNWLSKSKFTEDSDKMQDSVLRATSTKSAVDSSDSEATSQESNLRVILTQSSDSETQSSDSETQSSDSKTQSGKDSEPPQLNTISFDDSKEDDNDDDDDCEEKQEQAEKIDMILMYFEEHGRDVVEKYGTLLVLKELIKDDPYYDEDNLQYWFNSIVGHRNNRDYRELTKDELRALHKINVFPNDEQYLESMGNAYNMWLRECMRMSANKRRNNSNGSTRRVRKMKPIETDSDSDSDD
eukprot:scaffold13356_cov79-Skeletonema_marinoi.AAC.1